jgi:hypothetical protein
MRRTHGITYAATTRAALNPAAKYIVSRLSELKGGITVLNAEAEHERLFSRAHVLMDWVGDKSTFDDLYHLHPGPHTILSGSNRPNIPNAITVVSPRCSFGPKLHDWLCTLPSLKTVCVPRSDIPPVIHHPDFLREIVMPVRKVKPGGLANRSLQAMADLDGPPSISTSYIAWQSRVRRLC